jgi:hypothetical protein
MTSRNATPTLNHSRRTHTRAARPADCKSVKPRVRNSVAVKSLTPVQVAKRSSEAGMNLFAKALFLLCIWDYRRHARRKRSW